MRNGSVRCGKPRGFPSTNSPPRRASQRRIYGSLRTLSGRVAATGVCTFCHNLRLARSAAYSRGGRLGGASLVAAGIQEQNGIAGYPTERPRPARSCSNEVSRRAASNGRQLASTLLHADRDDRPKESPMITSMKALIDVPLQFPPDLHFRHSLQFG